LEGCSPTFKAECIAELEDIRAKIAEAETPAYEGEVQKYRLLRWAKTHQALAARHTRLTLLCLWSDWLGSRWYCRKRTTNFVKAVPCSECREMWDGIAKLRVLAPPEPGDERVQEPWEVGFRAGYESRFCDGAVGLCPYPVASKDARAWERWKDYGLDCVAIFPTHEDYVFEKETAPLKDFWDTVIKERSGQHSFVSRQIDRSTDFRTRKRK